VRIRIVSLGTNWWSAHPSDVADPFCFRRNPAWFNSAGLKYGGRRRLCWVYPGQVRFNQSSGFNPEYPNRVIGRTFECDGPNRKSGRMHLLITRAADPGAMPNRYLVTFSERLCGPIRFNRPGWKSAALQLISVSIRRERYEVMALMEESAWFESNVGPWMLASDCTRLVLSNSLPGGQP
jgi:hypothetical protein